MNKTMLVVLGFVAGLIAGLFIAHRLPGSEARSEAAPPSLERAAPAPGISARRPGRPQDSSMRAALSALEALESATRAGLTYQTYMDRKIDAHVTLDGYLRAFGSDAPLAITLQEAMDAYDAAGTLWGACVTSRGCEHGFLDPTTSYPDVTQVFEHYPGLSLVVPAGAGVAQDAALNFLWQHASTILVDARKVVAMIDK